MTEYCPNFDTEVLRLPYKAMGYVHCSSLVVSVLEADCRRRTHARAALVVYLLCSSQRPQVHEARPFRSILSSKNNSQFLPGTP
jgi:hypothetical protein